MEIPKPTELKKIVKFLREQGISSLKSGDFEITLSPSAIFPEAPANKDTGPDLPMENESQFTEEETLLWSVNGIPDDAGKEGT